MSGRIIPIGNNDGIWLAPQVVYDEMANMQRIIFEHRIGKMGDKEYAVERARMQARLIEIDALAASGWGGPRKLRDLVQKGTKKGGGAPKTVAEADRPLIHIPYMRKSLTGWKVPSVGYLESRLQRRQASPEKDVSFNFPLVRWGGAKWAATLGRIVTRYNASTGRNDGPMRPRAVREGVMARTTMGTYMTAGGEKVSVSARTTSRIQQYAAVTGEFFTLNPGYTGPLPITYGSFQTNGPRGPFDPARERITTVTQKRGSGASTIQTVVRIIVPIEKKQRDLSATYVSPAVYNKTGASAVVGFARRT